MKKFTLILIVLCFATQTLAQNTVLLISPLVQYEERDLPSKLDKNYKSFSKYYLENFPKERNVENLLNEFENAQKYYLVKSNDLAKQYYEKVVAFSDIDEWKDVHRKIIFLSFVRLAELNPSREEEWLSQALRFSLETDPRKLNLEKDLLKKVLDLKESFLKQTISWSVVPFKRDFNYILINGHVIELKKIDTVKIPAGKFRLTFLSDVYKLQTYQVSSQQIPLLIPTRIPFVSGNCQKPFFNNEGEIDSPVAVYYSKNCIKTQNGRKWIAGGETIQDEPLNRELGFTSTIQRDEQPFYKEKWFLITLGVIGVAATIYAVREGQKEKPTHETVNGF